MVGTSAIGRAELTEAIPRLSGTLRLKGLIGKVEVHRDGLGIPHVRAENERDAFFAQGYVTAQDRLWHMEYDRLRGSGRWAAAVGDAALEQDKLMRRFRLTASAKADYAVMDSHTRMVFDAYAAGVNAFIEGPGPLPAEYAIAGIEPEPWQPWDSLIVYKVRHILMGVFESKIWRARMVQAMGPEQAGRLFPGYEPGHLLILPPGATAPGPLDLGLKQLAEGAAALNHLSEMDAGSNSWVVAGQPPRRGTPGRRVWHRHRQAAAGRGLPPRAGHPQRLLPEPRRLPGVRRYRAVLPRRSRLPPLRPQPVGLLERHPHRRRLSGLVHRAVAGRQYAAVSLPRGVARRRSPRRNGAQQQRTRGIHPRGGHRPRPGHIRRP